MGESMNIPLIYQDEKTYNKSDSSIWLSKAGEYIISREFPFCVQTDTFTLSHKPPPILDLGTDSLICKIDTIILDVSEEQTSFKWEDGSEEPIRLINQPSTYTVEGWLNGCYGKNSIDIELEYCDSDLIMPIVITPNGDLKNEVFVPISSNGIVDINLSIYNRYGVELFTSNSFDLAWDGTTNLAPVPSGEYFCIVRYRDKNGQYSTIKGTLSVIR